MEKSRLIMKKFPAENWYGGTPASLLAEAVNGMVRALVRRQFAQSGEDWTSFVFGSADALITRQEIERIEQQVLATGYRFTSTSLVSLRERPDAYKDATGLGVDVSAFSFEHHDAITGSIDANGREQRGTGDNVVRHAADIDGVARYVRTSDQVIRYMQNGVPPDTIAIIDDSGCTLTAPIIDRFKGIICASGTVRSHLGILAREYGIPCLMNARISGIRDGDRIEIEASAAAKTAQDYQAGRESTARIWRFAR
ncbi:PEP-utilizing enzyme [Burkholderia ambifaria]|uniref:PEP-utilizing enzyme n=1 Tax=Burkholderia ambifaria TaxID=152480 RepID=UPI001FC826B0|nr:PEP-utilizing enzyme [Burkholderia ambifaria]